ncbi:DUF5677 domain-containing protein [Bacillus cereus]|uniref:DUF5677 domain-containing protein n=1 Tax=Bacillus cereus TaxID=1396 RepID=UPI000BFCDC37|nr:DUF5677 domain-containing protein [Bacillus cereus]PGU78807.1 hypothetical protein COD76_23280 [Bacillus cereus]
MLIFGGIFSNGVDFLKNTGNDLIGQIDKKTLAKPLKEDPYGIIKAYLVRLQNNVEAMIQLLKTGYGNPAIILQRTLVEDYLNLSYILKHPNIKPEFLINQFYEYLKKVQRYKHMGRLEKAGHTIEEALKNQITDGYNDFKTTYNNGKKTRDWSCKSLELQTRELSKALGDNKYNEIYYTMYNLLSEEYHMLSTTFLEHVNTSPTLKSASGLGDYRTDETMVGIITLYGELIEEIAKFHGISNRQYKKVAPKIIKKLKKQLP